MKENERILEERRDVMNQTTEEKQIIKKRALEDIAMWGRILSGFACLLFILTNVISISIFIMPFAEVQKGEMIILLMMMIGVTLLTSPAIRINQTVILAQEDLKAPKLADEQAYVNKVPRSFKLFLQLGVKSGEDKELLILIRYANFLRYIGFTVSLVIGLFASSILLMRFIQPLFL